jgi:hypothetical protein
MRMEYDSPIKSQLFLTTPVKRSPIDFLIQFACPGFLSDSFLQFVRLCLPLDLGGKYLLQRQSSLQWSFGKFSSKNEQVQDAIVVFQCTLLEK